MRLAEIHAFQQMIQPYFRIPTVKLPELTKGHHFETVVDGNTLDVNYSSFWDRFECIDRIKFESIRVSLDTYDLTSMLSKEVMDKITNEVERDFNDPEQGEDYQ